MDVQGGARDSDEALPRVAEGPGDVDEPGLPRVAAQHRAQRTQGVRAQGPPRLQGVGPVPDVCAAVARAVAHALDDTVHRAGGWERARTLICRAHTAVPVDVPAEADSAPGTSARRRTAILRFLVLCVLVCLRILLRIVLQLASRVCVLELTPRARVVFVITPQHARHTRHARVLHVHVHVARVQRAAVGPARRRRVAGHCGAHAGSGALCDVGVGRRGQHGHRHRSRGVCARAGGAKEGQVRDIFARACPCVW